MEGRQEFAGLFHVKDGGVFHGDLYLKLLLLGFVPIHPLVTEF